MSLLRPEIAALEQNGITRVALPRIGDPDVIALWFGEGDLVSERFIRDTAKQALDDGETFYAFPRLRGMRSSLDFAEGVLAEEDVGVAPGYTFGPGNEEYFRLCFALSHERLREGLERIVRYIECHDDEFQSE